MTLAKKASLSWFPSSRLLEMELNQQKSFKKIPGLQPHIRPTESESEGGAQEMVYLKSAPGDSRHKWGLAAMT